MTNQEIAARKLRSDLAGAIVAVVGEKQRLTSKLDASRATDVASRVLGPVKPAGLMQWLVPAKVGESPSAYARRSIRCLAARCAQAGLPLDIEETDATTIGMLDGHGSGGRGAVGLVSRLERSAALNRDEASS